MSCRSSLALALFLAWPCASIAAAQTPLDDGRTYLESVQNPSGSWGSTFEFVDTATAVETLAIVDPEGTAVADGATWLSGETALNHQHLARQVSALAGLDDFVGTSVPLSGTLLGVRNAFEFDTGLPNWPEGGWGVAPGFETDCTTTALALLALDAMGLAGGISVDDEPLPSGNNVHEWNIAADATTARILITVVDATVRLRMKQGSIPTNADPFFALPPGTFLILFPDSGIPFTPGQNFIKINATGSPASYTFTASYETPSLDTRSLGEALDYLQESQNVDGGWGLQRGQTTDFFTSLNVLLAIQAYAGYDLDVERAAGLAYLAGEQLAGGGFGFDGVNPLSQVTALGLLNLVRSETYPFSTATNDAATALLGLQDVGGSWEFFVFHTALAMRALWEHNQPPTADAGADQAVTDVDEGGDESIMLSGLGSDLDGTIIGYSWSEGGVEIATGAMPTVVLDVGVHDITLTVTDDGGRTGTDLVSVTVNAPCNAATSPTCQTVDEDVVLGWTQGGPYTETNIYRDAILIATLEAGPIEYVDVALPGGTYTYTIEGVCGAETAPGVDCIVVHTPPCDEVTDVTCVSQGADVDLGWSNGESYAEIEVLRDGGLIATLAGGSTAYTDPDVPSGEYTYTVRGVCPGSIAATDVTCKLSHTNPCTRELYCTAKRSSAGCRPLLESSGLPSLTGADDFFVNASQVLGDTTGFFLWSLNGNGPGIGGGPDPSLLGFSPRGVRLCVYRPTYAPTGNSGGTPGGCDGAYSFHFTQALMSSSGLLSGDDVFAQYVFRDPSHPDGSGLAHTRALRFTICP